MLTMLIAFAGWQSADEKMHGLNVMKLVRSFCSSPDEGKGMFNYHSVFPFIQINDFACFKHYWYFIFHSSELREKMN